MSHESDPTSPRSIRNRRPKKILLVLTALIIIVFLKSNPADAVNLELSPTIKVSERYNDNIFSEETNRDSDFITSIVSRLMAIYNARNINFVSRMGVGVELFARNSSLNNYQYNVDLKLKVDEFLKNSSLSLTDKFRFSPEPPAFLAGEEDEDLTTGGIRTGRGDTASNLSRARLIHRFSQKNQGGIEYSNRIQRFEDPTFVDSLEHRIALNFERQHKPKDTLKTGYNYRLFIPKGAKNTQSHSALVGFDRRFSRTFSGVAEWGATYAVRGKKNSVTFNGALKVNKRFKRTRLGLRYTAGLNMTSGLSDEPVSSQVLSGRIRHSLSRNLQVNFTQNVAQNRSTLTGITDLQSFQTQIGLRKEFYPWLKGRAGYSYFSQRSNGVRADLRRTELSVSLETSLQ